MRELLVMLGVDAGQIAFAPTNLATGNHILTGVAGNGYSVPVPVNEKVPVFVYIAESDWGRRVHWAILGENPEGGTLAGHVLSTTGQIMIADPCYQHDQDEKINGDVKRQLKFWGRDAKAFVDILTDNDIPSIDEGNHKYVVDEDHIEEAHALYVKHCTHGMALANLEVTLKALQSAMNQTGVPEEEAEKILVDLIAEHKVGNLLIVISAMSDSTNVYENACNASHGPASAGEYLTNLGLAVSTSSGYGDGVYPLVSHGDYFKVTYIGPDGEHPYDMPEENRGTPAFTG